MNIRRWGVVAAILVSAAIVVAGCSSGDGVTGALEFRANGEDFVREGFVAKDGWSITFDHVYVNLAAVTAYQTDPPYDAHSEGDIDAEVEVSLSGSYTVDLAEGGEDALPILVDTAGEAAPGHYNAISFEMSRASSGPAARYSLVIVGHAEKDGQAVDFTINVDEEYRYVCGEFIGDERKGIVEEGGTADLEMTFHFDHIFGDADAPPDDAVNVGAVGFDPFAEVAEDGNLDIDLAGLWTSLSAEDYETLGDALATLGHVGEGHCHCD